MPNSVPGPVTENVSIFVAILTILLLVSQILAVIKEVAQASAHIDVLLAVLIIFVGSKTVVTLIPP